jgi:hypothetical protein
MPSTSPILDGVIRLGAMRAPAERTRGCRLSTWRAVAADQASYEEASFASKGEVLLDTSGRTELTGALRRGGE